MESFASIREEIVTIPTYQIGTPEKNPMFLEKRVYQGSCGKVYPYPTIETISDIKVDQQYNAVFLENEYILIEILPALGGRVQRALDKTNNYDFVYYNHVIKPALVGLLGPWISGGIEFNWPQHHRPTTFMPVEYEIKNYPDGSVAVITHDTDKMYGTSASTEFRVYPGKAYLEIKGTLYNGTSLPQTFLWWANPAVSVNDNTKSIFPPDVHAVMDHGKRDVSDFPIAHGTYYKHDYSAGVDISRYKNIPVPTSYMAEKSNYDFVGGYDYGVEAGLLHVADHHISPGKKQWTWGNGDFGKAWDRNLTDEDGPYIELMTGMFTDNQPDFSWLMPHEEKVFTQYFMPYKTVGQVHNATKDIVIGLDCNENGAEIRVYTSSIHENVTVTLQYDESNLYSETLTLSPNRTLIKTVVMSGLKKDFLKLSVLDSNGHTLLSYTPEPDSTDSIPSPAKAIGAPEDIPTNEELLLAGKHLEQYRHATYLPDPYYKEGLKRDFGDYRINTAYGQLLLRRGLFKESEAYFRTAIERITKHNPNPFDSEAYYLLGLCLYLQGSFDEAYDSFYKACWKGEHQEVCFYYMALIAAKNKNYAMALEHIEKSLVRNYNSTYARAVKGYLLKALNQIDEAGNWLSENLKRNPFDKISSLELGDKVVFSDDYSSIEAARLYAAMGDYSMAVKVLGMSPDPSALNYYYTAYYLDKSGNALPSIDENVSTDYCFPNHIEDIEILTWAASHTSNGIPEYLLGCLFYDKLQWKLSYDLWLRAVAKNTSLPTVYRNLSLVYFNKLKDYEKAKEAIEKAFDMDPSDIRILMERDQLYKKLNVSAKARLTALEVYRDKLDIRDDLYVEYITLLNDNEQYEEAYELIMSHHFHPWEGGEGKITGQYTRACKALALKAIKECNYNKAKAIIEAAFTYPKNLGEGKLEGCKDNDLYYILGEIFELLGEAKKATECYNKATLGMGEIGMSMYYNDQPVDMVLYQGLANIKLGKKDIANDLADKLNSYGSEHINDTVNIEYFAVSLPDFLIYEDDLSARNHKHCTHMIDLAKELYEAL